MKERLKQLFMSREQIIYLLFLFANCIAYGMFTATFTYYEIGLGTRFYSLIICSGCIVGVIHAFVSADVKKKRWVFCHYKAIDLGESIFYTCTELGFAAYYFANNLNPLVDEVPVLNLFFFWSIFYRVVNGIVSVVIPSIGDVFEQSLYKNQIDYQNHSNAENLMCCFGAALGAGDIDFGVIYSTISDKSAHINYVNFINTFGIAPWVKLKKFMVSLPVGISYNSGNGTFTGTDINNKTFNDSYAFTYIDAFFKIEIGLLF